MKPSAIGFIFRQMHAAGVRVRAGHLGLPVPDGANLVLWEGTRFGWRNEIYFSEPTGEKIPVAWWLFEHKVGVREEAVYKSIRLADEMGKKTKPVKQLVEMIVDVYEPGIGTDLSEGLRQVLTSQASHYVFELGVTAELRDNNPGGFMQGIERYEWLECDKCQTTDLVPKKFGPATASRKCKQTPRCDGKVLRLPPIFSVELPKTIRKKKPKVSEPADVGCGDQTAEDRAA